MAATGPLNREHLFLQRRWAREVRIGDTPLGAGHPVRVQSMTNTDTSDVRATLEQSIRLVEAGCEYVRVTVPSLREIESLRALKKGLREAGFSTPLIADVHFNPKVAEEAARIVEKVRINPGNYTDGSDPAHELERIRVRLLPLIAICREYGTAIRVGTNHGSLSERIMHLYGDTPQGMAVSAMEFVRIFHAEGFHQLVLSMKASHTGIMMASTRLLVQMLSAEQMDYPIHLGVTEAGAGEDGRIRSAVGIGALLQEGVGDTIRVSLTGPPEEEIPVAKTLVAYASRSLSLPAPSSPLRVVRREISDIEEKHLFWRKEGFRAPGGAAGLVDWAENLPVSEVTRVLREARSEKPGLPLVVKRGYSGASLPDFQCKASFDLGSLLSEGVVDGLWLFDTDSRLTPETVADTTLNILQACRLRMSRTEYISCPSCGRTLFDIALAAEQIRLETGHLKGVKIAIMGCIVNGLGEMADADYGYVGAGRGKISLYKGKTLVKRNMPQEEAVAALVALLKENGDWRDP